MTNPFIGEREAFGRAEPFLDVAKFAEALAPLLGGVVGECEAGAYGLGRISIGDIVVSLRADHRKLGRVHVTSNAPAITRQTGHIGLCWPEANIDTSRPLERLAGDIKRRVVEPAAKPVEEAKAALAALNDNRANLERYAAALRQAIPGLEVTVPEDRQAYQASLYGSTKGVYFSGRLSASGSVSIDRVGSLDNAKAFKVLAALFAEG